MARVLGVQSLALSRTTTLDGLATFVNRWPTFGETTRRSFKRGEVVRGVLQIYQGTQRTDALMPVVMRVRILDAKGTALRDQSLPSRNRHSQTAAPTA